MSGCTISFTISWIPISINQSFKDLFKLFFQTLSEDTHSQLKRNVYQNYKQFIDTAKEISFLESEMYQLSHMITEQRNILTNLGQTSILGDKVSEFALVPSKFLR